MTDRYADGMRVRRAVLGDAHVDRAEAGRCALDKAQERVQQPSVSERRGHVMRELRQMTSKAAAICPFTLRGPRGVIEQLPTFQRVMISSMLESHT